MKKILLVLLLIITSIKPIYAYENEYFSIDIPENYKLTMNENNIYKWENKDRYISITVADNTQTKYNVGSYTDKDIEEQKEYIESNINKSLESYNIKVDVTNIEKIQLNNTYSLNYTIYWPTKELTGHDSFQVGNVISSEKYMTTIIYNCDDEIDQTEYNKIINSFKINDSLTKPVNKNPIIFILVILIATFLAIFNSIRKNKKRKTKQTKKRTRK